MSTGTAGNQIPRRAHHNNPLRRNRRPRQVQALSRESMRRLTARKTQKMLRLKAPSLRVAQFGLSRYRSCSTTTRHSSRVLPAGLWSRTQELSQIQTWLKLEGASIATSRPVRTSAGGHLCLVRSPHIQFTLILVPAGDLLIRMAGVHKCVRHRHIQGGRQRPGHPRHSQTS